MIPRPPGTCQSVDRSMSGSGAEANDDEPTDPLDGRLSDHDDLPVRFDRQVACVVRAPRDVRERPAAGAERAVSAAAGLQTQDPDVVRAAVADPPRDQQLAVRLDGDPLRLVEPRP